MMKKSTKISSLLFASAFILAGCNPEKPCEHIDEEPKDHVCDLCGEKMPGHEEHVYGAVVNDTATCTEAGMGHKTCEYCGHEEQVPVAALGHKDIDHNHICEVCQQTISQHSFSEWSEVTPATFEAQGLEHRICSECGKEETRPIEKLEHNFKQEWASDADKHWHECSDKGYESLKGSEASHVDSNKDFECDVCERELPGVESVTLIAPVTYMGRGEVLHLSSKVVKHCDVSDAVTFTLEEKSTDKVRYTLVDNHDGTADLSLTDDSSTNTFYAYVTVTSVADPSVFDKVTISCSTYAAAKITTIKSFFGVTDKHFIPFVGSTTFGAIDGDKLEITTTTSFAKTVGAFVNQGTWEKVSESTTEALFKIVDSKDAGLYYECLIESTSSGAKFTFTKKDVQLTTFPKAYFDEKIDGKTTSKFIAPDDGTLFTFTKTSSILVVTSNGDAEAYASKLSSNNYYVIESKTAYTCVSPERTLNVTINKITGGFTVSVSTTTAPTKTAWSSSDINKMTALIGEAIPFVANDYGAWSAGDGYAYASSTKLEASLVAIETLDKAVGYTKSVEQDGVYYTKDINEFSAYSIVVDGTELYIYVVPKQVTSWLGTQIASVLSVQSSDIPAATGTSFMYFFGTDTASVQVNGGDLAVYQSALEGAGYSIVEKRNSFGTVTATYAVSSDKTILIKLESDEGSINLTFSKQAAITAVDWTDADKEIMNSFMGGLLPYVPGFAGKWYSSVESIYATCTRIEAQVTAKAVLDADDTFIYDSGSSTAINLVYTKQVSKYEGIIVKVTSSGMITITKNVAKLSTWEASDIATALGSEPKETLPAFVEDGATFSYEFGKDAVTVFVYTDSSTVSMQSYKDALSNATFVTSDNATFKSPTDTLTVVVSKVASKQFKIEATGHLPEGQYRQLPLNTIVNDLARDPGLNLLPLPEGTLFSYEKNDNCDVSVSVLEGGSMTNYLTALGEAGFANVENVYTKGNLILTITAGEGDAYSARITLAEKPAGAQWPDDAKAVIAQILGAKYFKATELPAPTTSTSIVTDDGDGWVSYASVTVYGGNVEEYIQQLKNAGFYVDEEWASSYKEYDVYENEGSYLSYGDYIAIHFSSGSYTLKTY